MTDIHSALALLNTYVPQQSTPKDPTVNLLKALVEHAPTVLGKRNICQDIIACRSSTTNIADPAKLFQLQKRYSTGLLIPLVAKGGKTPQVTDHPSRRENVELQATLNEPLMDDAKLNFEQALARDNYRSVISGKIDHASADLGIVPGNGPSANYDFTEAAHILPFSLSEGRDPEQIRRNAEVWQLIEHFSGMELLVELNGQDINRLGNVLTLSMSEHKAFGTLKCWFEAVEGQPNTYRINARHSRYGPCPSGTVVTFTTTDETLELPNPRYLAIHAACAKVVLASGMAEYIDRVISDMEELAVLREDGSSDVQLMFALHRVSGQ